MAFTAAQKRDIRKYLGAPFGFYDLHTRLESMMDVIGANSTDQSEVDTWLTRLTAIDTALTGSSSSGSSFTYGSLKKADETEFYPLGEGESSGSSGIALVDQGRVLIDRLARALGVADEFPQGDYFGTRRPLTAAYGLG